MRYINVVLEQNRENQMFMGKSVPDGSSGAKKISLSLNFLVCGKAASWFLTLQ